MRENYGPSTGYTGRIIEAELFGEIKKELHRKLEYTSFKRAMETVRNQQPFSPSEPGPRFASDLQATIVQELNPEEYEKVRFYTAIGSALDRFHGIDGFLEWHFDPKAPRRCYVVTLDVTINPQKGKEYKADVLIQVPPQGIDPKDNKKDYDIILNEAIREILMKFQALSKAS